MNRIRVYLACPISKGNLLSNIRQVDEAFFRLMKAGFAPFNPILSVYAGGSVEESLDANTNAVLAYAERMPHGTTHEDWMCIDLPWVRVSEAVLRLPGESKGADQEVAEAKKLGIPVFYDEAELVNFFNLPLGD